MTLTQMRVDPATSSKTIVAFGIVDKKGREIGCRVSRYVAEYYVETGRTSGWAIEPGYYFAVRVHATRDGQDYGAMNDEHRFATEAGRELYIEQHLDRARAYNRKTFKA